MTRLGPLERPSSLLAFASPSGGWNLRLKVRIVPWDLPEQGSCHQRRARRRVHHRNGDRRLSSCHLRRLRYRRIAQQHPAGRQLKPGRRRQRPKRPRHPPARLQEPDRRKHRRSPRQAARCHRRSPGERRYHAQCSDALGSMPRTTAQRSGTWCRMRGWI
jgi:hypothetical protein